MQIGKLIYPFFTHSTHIYFYPNHLGHICIYVCVCVCVWCVCVCVRVCACVRAPSDQTRHSPPLPEDYLILNPLMHECPAAAAHL